MGLHYEYRLVNGVIYVDIEYCRFCDDIYAVRTSPWISFRVTSGETTRSTDKTFECPRCDAEILRHTEYLDALEKAESPLFIECVLADIRDLSDGSKGLIRELLRNFTVPSFSVQFDGKLGSSYGELVKKRYVVTTQVKGAEDLHGNITINAHKLGLMDNVELLSQMTVQAVFISNPHDFVKTNAGTLRRKVRMESLPNDFTDLQRSELLNRFGGKCALTGLDVPIQLDHVIPVAVGHGGTTLANMLPVWQRINSSKGAGNVFEWFDKRGEEYGVCPDMFAAAIAYLSGLNGMTVEEYRAYVYECHAHPNDYLTEAII